MKKKKTRKKSFRPLVFVQKRALGGSGDIGVVYIIGAHILSYYQTFFCQEPLIFDRLSNQAG